MSYFIQNVMLPKYKSKYISCNLFHLPSEYYFYGLRNNFLKIFQKQESNKSGYLNPMLQGHTGCGTNFTHKYLLLKDYSEINPLWLDFSFTEINNFNMFLRSPYIKCGVKICLFFSSNQKAKI